MMKWIVDQQSTYHITETLARFLIWQIAILKLLMHVHLHRMLSIQIAKFKFCQYKMRAISPNLILAKVTAIR